MGDFAVPFLSGQELWFEAPVFIKFLGDLGDREGDIVRSVRHSLGAGEVDCDLDCLVCGLVQHVRRHRVQ